MKARVIAKMGGRNILFRDELGLVHQCKGYQLERGARLFWTLCQRDAPADDVHAQAPGEVLTCPDCLAVASQPARRILEAHREQPKPSVGGLPYRLEPD